MYAIDSFPQAVLDLVINWSTIPGKVFRLCGFWKSGVKSRMLMPSKAIQNAANLYLDEKYTIVAQAIINSTSFTFFTDDAKHSHNLTPAMLLTSFHNHKLLSVISKTKDE